jgi:hypothetical protein
VHAEAVFDRPMDELDPSALDDAALAAHVATLPAGLESRWMTSRSASGVMGLSRLRQQGQIATKGASRD